MTGLTKRAWKVSNGEFCVVVCTDTRNRARQAGSGQLDCAYGETTAHRAPEFDGYAPNVPTDAELFDEFGWWFECHTCTGAAYRDSGGRLINGEITCASCIERAEIAGRSALTQEGG